MKRFSIKASILAVSAVITAAASCARTYPAGTENERQNFLSGKGITITGECAVKTVTIPEEFGDVYENYNELQKQSGFDLSRYHSREAQVYTYTVTAVSGQPQTGKEVHIIVCDGIVIGGDIASVSLDGEMQPLP